MNIAQVENNVKSLIERLAAGNVPAEDFIYELLLAYGHRASTVSMLRNGHYNIAKDPGEIIFKRHLYFKQMQGNALHAEIDRMKNQKLVATNRTRFVVCTNFDHLLAVDTKTGDSLDIALAELPRKFDFFLPWAGMEKAVYQGENPADVKAAEKMAKLFDLIKADNFNEERAGDNAALHNLNVFLTRLLFCFFAEDTEIFADNQFSNAIQGHTSEDGSDLAEYLNRLFTVLNTPEKERGALPDYLSSFPYVNGGLFADNIPSPGFSRKSRRMLIECGSELNWSDINPDIFGSMIQAVVHPDQRGGMGMHYTSVTNIMKVIEPLFLNDLYEELDKVSNSATKLQKLQQRLGEVKIFDPACGSGNFLIIAYKELRRLEMELLKRWQELELEKTGQVLQAFSVIKLSQFYGIELDDFAHEVAILSLWLAEHQMNSEFRIEFGRSLPNLPLKNGGNILCQNALHVAWMDICNIKKNDEVYILGNPPYIGSKLQTKQQKNEVSELFKGIKGGRILDYISCWFKCAADFIKTCNAQSAFVTTNSIVQGEQVGILWPNILGEELEIGFAHEGFKWSNNARSNAGVTCVIVGIRKRSNQGKYLFTKLHSTKVKNINYYLVAADNVVVRKSSTSISWLPKMKIGNKPIDDGNYLFSRDEFLDFVQKEKNSQPYFRRWMGSKEFLQGTERWCLLTKDIPKQSLKDMPLVNERVDQVRKFRSESGSAPTQKISETPQRFHVENFPSGTYIVVPKVSSERREYIPCGFFEKSVVSSDLLNLIDSDDPVLFGIVSSKIHNVWVRAVSGTLESRIRYSSSLSYHTFPFPRITPEQQSAIAEKALDVLSAREQYSASTISQLYDPEKMPNSLKAAHHLLDLEVDKCFQPQPFTTDEDRLECLMLRYVEMTGGQNA